MDEDKDQEFYWVSTTRKNRIKLLGLRSMAKDDKVSNIVFTEALFDIINSLDKTDTEKKI